MELFRPDIVTSVGTHDGLAQFDERYAFLRNSGFPSKPFHPPHGDREGTATVLDVRNLMVHRRDDPDWKAMVEHGIQVATWESVDPLADAFLVQFGQYPEQQVIGIDYRGSLDQATRAIDLPIPNGGLLPVELLRHPGISHLSRYDLTAHYSGRIGWDYPGFYVGNATNVDDLVTFWNLRACGIHMTWHDLDHHGRFDLVKAEHEANLRTNLAGKVHHLNNPAIWFRDVNREAAAAYLVMDSFRSAG